MSFSPLIPDAAPKPRPLLRGRLQGWTLARFGRDKTGAAALEFALIALPFIATILCIVEIALDFFFFSHIDYAVHKSLQQIRSGSVQTQKLDPGRFKAEVLCPQMSSLPCEPVLVNMRVMKSWCCSADGWTGWTATTVSADTAKWCPGGSADLVFLQIAYPIPFGSIIWSGSSSIADGKRYYLSTAAVRNDPFGLPADTTPGC